MDAFDIVPGYRDQIVLGGKEPLVLRLIAFLITFALTRVYTRLARVWRWEAAASVWTS